MKKVMGKMVPALMGTLFKKNCTVLYPAVPAKTPAHFRGALKYDQEKCIGCNICMRVCPAYAITIEKVADKKFKAVVRMDKCIFCGQCVDSCPKDALENTKEFELATLGKESLTRDI